MKTTVNENNLIQLEEVFNPIVLKSGSGERLSICMRDSGFEFMYEGKMYSAKEGEVKEIQMTSSIEDLELPQTNQE